MNLFKRAQLAIKKVWARIRGKRYVEPTKPPKVNVITQEQAKTQSVILPSTNPKIKVEKGETKDYNYAAELEFTEQFYEHLKNLTLEDISAESVRILFSKGRILLGRRDKNNKPSLYIDINPQFFELFLDIKNKIKELDNISKETDSLVKRFYSLMHDYNVNNTYEYSDIEAELNIISAEQLLNSLAKSVGISTLTVDVRKRYESK